MTETDGIIIAACAFKWNPSKTYDYLCKFPVAAGDKVIVETRNGDTVVEVMEIKESSDVAEKFLKGFAPKSDEEDGDEA